MVEGSALKRDTGSHSHLFKNPHLRIIFIADIRGQGWGRERVRERERERERERHLSGASHMHSDQELNSQPRYAP